MNLYSGFASDVSVGDIVSVTKGLFTHVGVVVPDGVLENSPGSFERVIPWHEFARGGPVKIQHTGAEAWLVMHRAAKILASPRRYDALSQNCEHTVNEVVYGTGKSPQLGAVVVGALAGLVIVAAIAD